MRGATYTPPDEPVEKPVESEEKPRVRARNKKGHFLPDDPSTPDVNEAWETKE